MKHFKSRKRAARGRKKASAKERRKVERAAVDVEDALTVNGFMRQFLKGIEFAKRYSSMGTLTGRIRPFKRHVVMPDRSPVVNIDYSQLETAVFASVFGKRPKKP